MCADCLPLMGAASRLAAALQLCAAQADVHDPAQRMVLAVHPAIQSAVHMVHGRVATGGALKMESYCLVFPLLEGVLGLPNRSALHDEALEILSAHVDAGLRDMLPAHMRLLFHLITVASVFNSAVRCPLLTRRFQKPRRFPTVHCPCTESFSGFVPSASLLLPLLAEPCVAHSGPVSCGAGLAVRWRAVRWS